MQEQSELIGGLMHRSVAILVKAESKDEAFWKLTDFMKKEYTVNCYFPDYEWVLRGGPGANAFRKLDEPGFYDEFMASWADDHYAAVKNKWDEIHQRLDSGTLTFEKGKDLGLGYCLKELGNLICQNFSEAKVFNLERHMYDVPGKDAEDFDKYYVVMVDIHR
jgi:hypothetical protein